MLLVVEVGFGVVLLVIDVGFSVVLLVVEVGNGVVLLVVEAGFDVVLGVVVAGFDDELLVVEVSFVVILLVSEFNHNGYPERNYVLSQRSLIQFQHFDIKNVKMIILHVWTQQSKEQEIKCNESSSMKEKEIVISIFFV